MTYLQVYNTIYLDAWGVVWALSAVLLFYNSAQLRNAVLYGMLAVQTSMVMETVHALLGISSAKPHISLFQFSMRAGFAWLIIPRLAKTAQLPFGLYPLISGWALGEIIRYWYYVCHSPKSEWARYNLFPISFLLGYIGECSLIYWLFTETRSKLIAAVVPIH